MNELARLEPRAALALLARDHLPRLLDRRARRDHGEASRARTSTGSIPRGAEELRRIFARAERGEGFGNARFARTIFEQALNAQALRLAGSSEGGVDELVRLEGPDFAAAAAAVGANEEPSARRRLWQR